MKNQKKLFPDVDGPKYGIPFKVIGFQAQTEEDCFTELIDTEPKEFFTLKNRREYINWKWDLSKEICDSFNKMLSKRWNKIVSFKVKYLCETEDHFI